MLKASDCWFQTLIDSTEPGKTADVYYTIPEGPFTADNDLSELLGGSLLKFKAVMYS